MAHVSGKTGNVSTGANVTGIKSWSIDYSADALETTDFADAGVRTYIAGCTGWSGSFEGEKDGVPQGIGSEITLTLYETSTANQLWTGNCLITRVSATSSADGKPTYTYDFQGTGALTVPTA